MTFGFSCWPHKYVDDTAITEIVDKDKISQMQSAVDKLVNWSVSNHMNIKSQNTAETIRGPLSKQVISPVMISDQIVKQMTSFKLLGVTVSYSDGPISSF